MKSEKEKPHSHVETEKLDNLLNLLLLFHGQLKIQRKTFHSYSLTLPLLGLLVPAPFTGGGGGGGEESAGPPAISKTLVP